MTEMVDIKIASDPAEIESALSVRRQVFVNELGVDEKDEFDGNDYINTTHILALVGSKPIGTIRIRNYGEFAKFERACVLPEYRKTNVSELIMDAALKLTSARGYNIARGMCKKELLPRWERINAFENKDLEPVKHHGQEFIEITHQLPKLKNKITAKTPAIILTLKEGEWYKDEKIFGTHELIRKDTTNRMAELLKKVKILKVKPKTRTLDWHPPLEINPIDFFDPRKR